MTPRSTLVAAAAAALILSGCGDTPADEPSVTLPATPAPSATPTSSPTPPVEPDPPTEEPGEGPGENDPGPGYVDTSFVYPEVLVDQSTIPPGDLGDYVHFEFHFDAKNTTPASNGVSQYVCVASFTGWHGCVTLQVGDTMVPLDIYVLPGNSLHFGMSDSATPMAGAFYYFDDIQDQPGFTAGSWFWMESVLTFGDTQNDYGIFLPTMHLKD